MSSVSVLARWFAVWSLVAGVPAAVADDADTTPPKPVRPNGYDDASGSLYIFISEPLDPDSTPAMSAFGLRIGGVNRELSEVGAGPLGASSPKHAGLLILTLAQKATRADFDRQRWKVLYRQPSDNPLQDLAGNLMPSFDMSWCWGGCPEDGVPPPPEPEPEPDPEPEPEPKPACPVRLAPYWHGTGGFAVRPTDGESATVRIECAGKSHTSRERAGEDGLIVRTVSQPMCTADDGRPIEGEMTFEGIDGDGWYWINGDRNVAVAPLVCEESLKPDLRPPIPGGVTARPSGDRRFVLSVRGTWHGTLMVHNETGFMGIVPHLVDLEGSGEHVAPYWKGGGGIVGRPLDGSRATVRLACGEADAESQVLDAGEDGLIVALLPGCFDEDGVAVSGRLEADGLEDGAWYWLNTGTASAAAPLLRRGADVDLTVPVLPAGVDADEGPLGTLFSRGPLMGVVPRVERIED
ncbi:MAG: hypothetical protein OXI49_02900 [Acidobacteriota bacterium]|nr:hypothetical protein [Acidobacteriota bacterium]